MIKHLYTLLLTVLFTVLAAVAQFRAPNGREYSQHCIISDNAGPIEYFWNPQNPQDVWGTASEFYTYREIDGKPSDGTVYNHPMESYREDCENPPVTSTTGGN